MTKNYIFQISVFAGYKKVRYDSSILNSTKFHTIVVFKDELRNFVTVFGGAVPLRLKCAHYIFTISLTVTSVKSLINLTIL